MTDDRRALATLLLVLQAGLAALAALGLLVYARLSNALGGLAGSEALAIGGPLILLLCAVGVARRWRVARFGIYAWQALTLLGTAFSLRASGGANPTLTTALTGIALPLAIGVVVSRPSPIRPAIDLARALTTGLLLLVGVIHLALVPEHWNSQPRFGPLFALDGVAFVIVALASLRYQWWRATAALLLALTMLAYVVVVGRGLEGVNDLAIASLLIELGAFGLVLWPCGARLSWRLAMPGATLLLALGLSGSIAWAASFRAGPGGHTHDGKVVLTGAPPTDAQRLAAARLVEDTRTGIEPFADVNVATASGYRPSTPPQAPTVHYVNPAFKNGHVLDSLHPQALVYANTPGGALLLGAMYMLPQATAPVPDVGGTLVEWHTHNNLCFWLPTLAIDGFESPFGTCPLGSINGPTPPMLHVWTVANPGGSFGDLSPAYVRRLTQGSASTMPGPPAAARP